MLLVLVIAFSAYNVITELLNIKDMVGSGLVIHETDSAVLSTGLWIMDNLYEDVLNSDSLIFGTPVHMGFATGIMMTFMERIAWTFGKPERRILTVSGCPMPRSDKKRKAIIIVTSGIISPKYRRFCDQATPLIKGTTKDSLNAKTVGDMYAGDIEHRGLDRYFDKAFKLGKKLV